MPVPADDELVALSQHLRQLAADAARSVAPMLRSAFRAPQHITYKSGYQDLVTEHDRASEQAISALLFDAHPDSRILGEEGGTAGEGRVLWLVDPIDGTTNFASGLAQFCVSIAAAVDGHLVAGAIHDPVADELFTADLTGAWLGSEALHSTGATSAREAVILTDFPAPWDLAAGAQAEADFGALAREFRSIRRGGSAALALAYTAAGRVDCTLGTRTNPWDVGAGALIVQQAGGRFLGFADGAPVTEAVYEAPNYVAFAGDADYPQVTEVVRRR